MKKQSQFASKQNGVNSYLKGDYDKNPPRRAQKNKANLSRIEYCVMRIAKANLKKQSQFVSGRIGAKSYMQGNYDNMSVFEALKNKANQTQFKAKYGA